MEKNKDHKSVEIFQRSTIFLGIKNIFLKECGLSIFGKI